MMTINLLTEEIALEALRNFFREKPFVFLGTGMSCALDVRFGMNALKDALVDQIRICSLTADQKTEWSSVETALEKGRDLESALNGVNDQELIRTITRIAGKFIVSIDREYVYRIARGDIEWPATALLKRLVDTLPEGDKILHCLTPNYDMLLEYACDYANIPYTNGFSGCVQRQIDWGAVERSLLVPDRVHQRGKLKIVYRHRKHVRLYKVHGSLNCFFHQNAVIENNAWMWDPPDFVQRVMITPGLSKYEMLHCYRQELLQCADAAIDKSNHFLFLGYGFNDSHLEEYIKRKLISQNCKGVIITRDSNPRIESLLADATNLWLVCKTEDPKCDGARIFNKQYSDWLSLPDKRLWDIREFTTHIFGG